VTKKPGPDKTYIRIYVKAQTARDLDDFAKRTGIRDLSKDQIIQILISRAKG